MMVDDAWAFPHSPASTQSGVLSLRCCRCYIATILNLYRFCGMTGKGKTLTTKQIIKLAIKHENPPFSVRDAALIACSGLAFMTLFDLSLVRVRDLMDDKGRIYNQLTIPPEYNPSGKTKLIFIPQTGYLRQILDRYVQFRIDHEQFITNLGIYRHLNPDSFFFLDDHSQPFHLTSRTKGDTAIAQMQPFRMRRLFKSFVFPEGVTPISLNQSFALNFYKASIEVGFPIKTLKSLQGITGLGLDTLRKWVKREPRTIEDILQACTQ